MELRWRAALGFGIGSLIGIVIAFALSMLSISPEAFSGTSSSPGVENLLSLAAGGLVAGAIGGSTLERGVLPILGYGVFFALLYIVWAFFLLSFL